MTALACVSAMAEPTRDSIVAQLDDNTTYIGAFSGMWEVTSGSATGEGVWAGDAPSSYWGVYKPLGDTSVGNPNALTLKYFLKQDRSGPVSTYDSVLSPNVAVGAGPQYSLADYGLSPGDQFGLFLEDKAVPNTWYSEPQLNAGQVQMVVYKSKKYQDTYYVCYEDRSLSGEPALTDYNDFVVTYAGVRLVPEGGALLLLAAGLAPLALIRRRRSA